MISSQTLAIIGSGPSAIYLLKHLLDHAELLGTVLKEIVIFEKNAFTGMGMPYSPQTTDRYNQSNISSEELPELPMTLVDWLHAQTAAVLESLDIDPNEISESAIYGRLALGEYFKAQYQLLAAWLVEAGIRVHHHAECRIVDIQDDPSTQRVTLFTEQGEVYEFSRVVIATGHQWPDEDVPEAGYYASPWPISKLLPEEGQHYQGVIGTLGASLSAFDVISSLAHRHGEFFQEGGSLKYRPHPGTESFKMVMHSSKGLLPHLQFEQVEPQREIYRYVDHAGMVALMDKKGVLRMETYFDRVCRPVLLEAFRKDGMKDMIARIQDPSFSLEDFVETMGDKHDYPNAFEGMRMEMKEAEVSVQQKRPIHWKEAVDDLMYTLNYYAGSLPAEDHLLLREKVMPFLLNVIAAMPLPSGNAILALYDAGKLDLMSGSVTQVRKLKAKGATAVKVEEDGHESTFTYSMFVDCSGQSPVELKDYPFPSLVKSKAVREARAPFLTEKAATQVARENPDLIVKEPSRKLLKTGGIEIDDNYQVVGSDGQANPRIFDIAFPHTPGRRPYSYGLQACSHTSAIVVEAWIKDLKADGKGSTATEKASFQSAA